MNNFINYNVLNENVLKTFDFYTPVIHATIWKMYKMYYRLVFEVCISKYILFVLLQNKFFLTRQLALSKMPFVPPRKVLEIWCYQNQSWAYLVYDLLSIQLFN